MKIFEKIFNNREWKEEEKAIESGGYNVTWILKKGLMKKEKWRLDNCGRF